MANSIRRRDVITLAAGAAASPIAWPLTARAQQRAVPVIGYLSTNGEGGDFYSPAFQQGLRDQGYVEVRNVEILYRYADMQLDRLPALAAELVRRRVAVIIQMGSQASLFAAKAATATIPIVFINATDPVEIGLVASLNRPDGNLTGVYFLDQAVDAKRVQLLHELVPAASTIGLLVNPTSPPTQVDPAVKEAENAARILGVRLVVLPVSTAGEIEAAFANLAGRRIEALMVMADVFFTGERVQLAVLAARHAVPVHYPNREFVKAGGLVSYGANLSDAFRLSGTYVGRILKGDKPADLPVQQSTRIEMVLNLKTAKALGIEVPTATLLRADEVIE